MKTRSSTHALMMGVVLFMLISLILLASPSVATRADAPAQAATQAANPACPDIVKAALAATNQECASTGRNKLCYGNVSLKADPQPGATGFTFGQPGDVVDLSSIQTLQLSALDPDNKIWGIALMRVQANLPDTAPGQNVTVLVFGDVQIQNMVKPPATTTQVTVTSNTNVLNLPNGTPIGTLPANASASAIGQIKGGTWLRVQVPAIASAPALTGWIPAHLVSATGDLTALAVVDPNAPTYGPMQAFYFRAGTGAPACKEAPANGILLQTPKNNTKIDMSVNDIKITLGSTVLVEGGQPNDEVEFTPLDGSVRVESFGQFETARPGLKIGVKLDAQARPASAPNPMEAVNWNDLSTLPIQNLPLPTTNSQLLTGFQARYVVTEGATHFTVTPQKTVSGPLTYEWSNSNSCGTFTGTNTSAEAIWQFGNTGQPNGCPAEAVHPGTITVVVRDSQGREQTIVYTGGSANGTVTP